MMKKFLTVYLVLLAIQLYSQTKIVFTAIDYSINEVRASICDSDGNNRNELGFNKTYLPVWFNDKILLNSDSFIWQCDTSGENLQKLFPGYRASVSNSKKMFAFYDRDGIAIADEKGKVIKQISVNTFQDAAITWTKNDDKVSYFDPEKKICYLFNLTTDSLEIFGDSIYHPVWSPKNNFLLYNQALQDGKFSIVLKNLQTNVKVIVNKNNENTVVPIWSNTGNKIAYLSFKIAVEDTPESDLIPCSLILYDIASRKSILLSEEAGFTDKAYPQMCFDDEDKFLYFTKINEYNLGSIARVSLLTLQQENISNNASIDERIPQIKTFK